MGLKSRKTALAQHPGSEPAASLAAPPAVTFDDLLVAVAQTRNRDAFVRLFEHFAPRIKSFLMKGGMAPDLADELAQETMLAVWQKASQFDPLQASAGTWIFTIARNRRIDALRRFARTPDNAAAAMDLTMPEFVSVDQEIDRAAKSHALGEAIRALPAEQAELLHKSFFEEKSHAVIAGETGLPLGTVKSRIRLALNHLRRALPESYAEDLHESH